ncbi:MAG: DUF4292 domain-containing protein [Ignavibacteria bacterium]
MKKIIQLLIIVVFSLNIISCGTSKKVINYEISFDEINESLKINYDKMKSYSANGSAELNLNEIKLTVQFDLQVLKPSSATIDLFGPFGFEIASAYLKDDSINIYIAIDNQLIKTSFSSNRINASEFGEVFKRIIYPLFFGYFNIDVIEGDSTKYISTEEKFGVIKFLKNSVLEIYYDRSKYFFSEIAFSKNFSNKKVLISFQELKEFNGIKFPMRIDIINEDTQESISISFKKIEFNKINEELQFSVPENVKVKEW